MQLLRILNLKDEGVANVHFGKRVFRSILSGWRKASFNLIPFRLLNILRRIAEHFPEIVYGLVAKIALTLPFSDKGGCDVGNEFLAQLGITISVFASVESLRNDLPGSLLGGVGHAASSCCGIHFS
jgi:hypothetical protein